MKGRTSKGTEAVAAEVFLRSASGRSLSEIAESPLPQDLSPFRPPAAARDEVHRFLLAAGFKVFADESGLTLSIEGPAATFKKVFGASPARITGIAAGDTVSLHPPAAIQNLIDKIVVLPKPERY